MRAIDDWLIEHGNRVASELDRRADQICRAVSAQLERTYPGLCLDLDRADAVQFQKQMFEASPRRMHRLLQTALAQFLVQQGSARPEVRELYLDGLFGSGL